VFLESVIFAVLCRPENSPGNVKTSEGSMLPIWVWLSFAVATAVLGWRFFKTRKPIEPGFAWCVAAVFLWLEFAPVGKMSDAYVGTAALILGASLIETSYVLAYHDELTGIRGRRAFNESLLSLDQQYSIAIVDIDHFKKFNDTYGHDVGDQVLCMVASRLSQVEGNGQAFRCGGEEFAIVFRNLSAKDAFEHLDALRRVIEKSTFQLRAGDRRAEGKVEKANERRAGESDRRRSTKKKPAASPKPAADRLSVTVSIGVAEPSTRNRQPEQVIQAADQALYRAKEKGRNRVELASIGTPRIAERKVAKSSRS
jgi:diguanylate cyclase (GGDEF)-like protein